LASQLRFDDSKAVFQKVTSHGRFYEQTIPTTGPNGRTIDVAYIFMKDRFGKVTFITGKPAK
jgi:hypothetical protein